MGPAPSLCAYITLKSDIIKLNTLEEAKAEMKNRVGETEYFFAIVLKESNKVIGEIDAFPESGESHSDANAVKDTFSPCWMLNLNYTGKGYAFEAAHAFLIIFSRRKAQGEFMPIPRITTNRAGTFAKSSE